MICADANVLIAAIDPSDVFHDIATAELVEYDYSVALTVTWAEALVHPHRLGQAGMAQDLLADYGIEMQPVDAEMALTASALRAEHGGRDFPLLDALVVAAGITMSIPVITTDAKWPDIAGVDVRVLRT